MMLKKTFSPLRTGGRFGLIFLCGAKEQKVTIATSYFKCQGLRTSVFEIFISTHNSNGSKRHL